MLRGHCSSLSRRSHVWNYDSETLHPSSLVSLNIGRQPSALDGTSVPVEQVVDTRGEYGATTKQLYSGVATHHSVQ